MVSAAVTKWIDHQRPGDVRARRWGVLTLPHSGVVYLDNDASGRSSVDEALLLGDLGILVTSRRDT